MDKDEALQMCLEYIETDAHERKYVRHAIKQALAAQPAPAAHRDGHWCVDLTCKKCYSADFRLKHSATPPAAQRQWVGLTDEERWVIFEKNQTTNSVINAIEAKLKEKNT